MKHLRPHELDDEQRALINAVRHLDDDYAAIRAANLTNTVYGDDWGRILQNGRCETCNRHGSFSHGYCIECRPETYEGDY